MSKLPQISANNFTRYNMRLSSSRAFRIENTKYLEQFIDLNKYGIKIGGTTSIDITKKGLDKEWGIREFLQHHNLSPDQVIFFGDKIYPGGNDYPATKIVDCVAVENHQDCLTKLKKLFPVNLRKSTIDNRPWGKFEQFTHDETSTVKILEVNPNQRLSLQSHQNRDEMWVALDDNVITEINGNRKVLQAGEKVFIPKKAKHRLSSESDKVRVLEVSFGKFDEDDITRHEDDYSRV